MIKKTFETNKGTSFGFQQEYTTNLIDCTQQPVFHSLLRKSIKNAYNISTHTSCHKIQATPNEGNSLSKKVIVVRECH